jgi:hypothetical protein
VGAIVTESGPPSDDELLKQLEEELKTLEVSDVLVQTLYTVSSLGYRRLSEEGRDLDQARLAIEALRALLRPCSREQQAQSSCGTSSR